MELESACATFARSASSSAPVSASPDRHWGGRVVVLRLGLPTLERILVYVLHKEGLQTLRKEETT